MGGGVTPLRFRRAGFDFGLVRTEAFSRIATATAIAVVRQTHRLRVSLPVDANAETHVAKCRAMRWRLHRASVEALREPPSRLDPVWALSDPRQSIAPGQSVSDICPQMSRDDVLDERPSATRPTHRVSSSVAGPCRRRDWSATLITWRRDTRPTGGRTGSGKRPCSRAPPPITGRVANHMPRRWPTCSQSSWISTVVDVSSTSVADQAPSLCASPIILRASLVSTRIEG